MSLLHLYIGLPFNFKGHKPKQIIEKFNAFLTEEIGETLTFTKPQKNFKSYICNTEINEQKMKVKIRFTEVYGGQVFGEIKIHEK